ncbi:MAG: FAD/NAD(P)-binding protein [Alkalilacustris sp.]
MRRPAALRVAVIGAGPRALGALEALAGRHPGPLQITVLDPTAHPGAGPNFDPEQPALNLLNTPLHALDLPAPCRPDADIGTVQSWLFAQGCPPAPETYLPRATLGRYLVARWRALEAHLTTCWGPDALRHHRTRAEALEHGPGGWRIRTEATQLEGYDTVLLCPGQPATRPDAQLARWRAHARATGARLLPAYPTDGLIGAPGGWAGRSVAIRGLALSAFDVVRALTLGLGGRFEGGQYIPSGLEPARVLPFSLDGQPPMPKPATAAIDAVFDPGQAGRSWLVAALAQGVRAAAGRPPGPEATRACLAPLVPALTPMVVTAMRRAGAVPGGAGHGRGACPGAWLTAEIVGQAPPEHPDPVRALAHGIAMAEGRRPPSAGFAAGQVWRHLQPALRAAYSALRPGPAAAAALVGFDAGLKRYSYGPPVQSARELGWLIAAGRVSLRAAEDPDIDLAPRLWRLCDGAGGWIEADTMVDAVLPTPGLEAVEEPLLAELRDKGLLQPLGEGLGAAIRPDGTPLPHAGSGLALLGRLATGSLIGCDSIHDCFGAPVMAWARASGARGRP